MLTALILAAVAKPMLLVSCVEGMNVELFTIPVGAGDEKVVIHRHPLSLALGKPTVVEGMTYFMNSPEGERHNDLLARSLAFAIDRKRRRIACFNLINSRSYELRSATVTADLLTLDYAGKEIHKNRVTFPRDDQIFIGIGNDGFASLIRRPERDRSTFQVSSGAEWLTVLKSDLPASFLAQFKATDAELDLKYERQRRMKPDYDDVASSPAWVDIELPLYRQVSNSSKLSLDGSQAATLYGSEMFGMESWIFGRWGNRVVSATFNTKAVVPMHLYSLAYPQLVGRDLSGQKMLPQFLNRALGDRDPFMDSKIVIYDLVTKKVHPLCKGILAIPM